MIQNNELWSAQEWTLIDYTARQLSKTGMIAENEQFNAVMDALGHQHKALSLYPSILASNRLGTEERNAETLVTELSSKYREDDIFVMPTKAVLGRCFAISKINVFYMLRTLLRTIDMADTKLQDINALITTRLLSVMTEDVLLELLSDPFMSINVKSSAAKTLAMVWEYRTDAEMPSFIPALKSMWMIRRESLPIFGTLLGTHEYMNLCKNADSICRSYIWHASEIPDEAMALEEFLFGLSYEDLNDVKRLIKKNGNSFLDADVIEKFLGGNAVFLYRQSEEPLELYRFFNIRRKHATSRRFSRSRGPIRTFEENFMAYLLVNMQPSNNKFTEEKQDEAS